MSKQVSWCTMVAIGWLLGLLFASCSKGPEGEAAPAISRTGSDGQRQVFSVEGMTCESCVGTVTTAIEDLPGVADVDVSLEARQAVVIGSPDEVSAQAVIAAIEKAGYKASLSEDSNGEAVEPSFERPGEESS